MTIQVGDRMPAGELAHMGPEGIETITAEELFGGKRVVLFAVPGAFTPTCSANHLPGFLDLAAEIKAKGIDTIACMAVNDVFVMDAWGKDRGVVDEVLMLADGNGDFTRALGLEFDGSGFGMGMRSQRFALLADDGQVTALHVDPPGHFELSSAEYVLEQL